MVVERWNSNMMENRSDGMLNYRRFGFGYCKTETEPSDGFPQTPTGTVPKDIGREVKKVQGCTRMLGLKPISLVIGKDRLTVESRRIGCSISSIRSQGHNHWGIRGVRTPPKNWRDHPNFFWWRVWLPLRNRLQCTKLGIPSAFCSVQ